MILKSSIVFQKCELDIPKEKTFPYYLKLQTVYCVCFFLVLLVIQYCIEQALNYFKEETVVCILCFHIENNLNYIRHREDYNK